MPCCVNTHACRYQASLGPEAASGVQPIGIPTRVLWVLLREWAELSQGAWGPGEVQVLEENKNDTLPVLAPFPRHLYFRLFPRFPHLHPFFPLQYYL